MHNNPRLALAAYAFLAVAAWFTLHDPADDKFLWMVWLILGLFALRTLAVVLRPPTD